MNIDFDYIEYLIKEHDMQVRLADEGFRRVCKGIADKEGVKPTEVAKVIMEWYHPSLRK